MKMYHIRFFIVEKIGLGMASRQCGIHSKSQPLLQKICLFHAFEMLAAYVGTSCVRKMCLCMQNVLAYAASVSKACFGQRMQASAHLCGPRATLVI